MEDADSKLESKTLSELAMFFDGRLGEALNL